MLDHPASADLVLPASSIASGFDKGLLWLRACCGDVLVMRRSIRIIAAAPLLAIRCYRMVGRGDGLPILRPRCCVEPLATTPACYVWSSGATSTARRWLSADVLSADVSAAAHHHRLVDRPVLAASAALPRELEYVRHSRDYARLLMHSMPLNSVPQNLSRRRPPPVAMASTPAPEGEPCEHPHLPVFKWAETSEKVGAFAVRPLLSVSLSPRGLRRQAGLGQEREVLPRCGQVYVTIDVQDVREPNISISHISTESIRYGEALSLCARASHLLKFILLPPSSTARSCLMHTR